MRLGRRTEKIAKCKWLLVMVSFLVTLEDLSRGALLVLKVSRSRPPASGQPVAASAVRSGLLGGEAVSLDSRGVCCEPGTEVPAVLWNTGSELWMWGGGTVPDCLHLGCCGEPWWSPEVEMMWGTVLKVCRWGDVRFHAQSSVVGVMWSIVPDPW